MNDRIGKLPLSIARFEETKLEHSIHSEDHAVEIERPRISTKTTQPDTNSSDLASISLEMSDEGDLPSKEAYVEPIKDSEPVEHSSEVLNGKPRSINGAIVGRKGPDPESISHSAKSLQPPAWTAIRSYAKVDGKWVVPKEGRNNTPSGGQTPTSNSTEASRSETRTGVQVLDNVTGDQSFPLPEPDREFATASSEIDSNISQNKPNIQANGPMIGIKMVNAAKLLSQLEHFLEENGSFKPDKKPIKFKDAVGRGFSFPFELAATWAVSVKFTSSIL